MSAERRVAINGQAAKAMAREVGPTLRRGYAWFRGLRHETSDVLVQMAALLLVTSMWLLAATWMLADVQGRLPSGLWGVYTGNHGPWRHFYDLRHLVFLSCFAIPSFSVLLGAFSLVLRPSLRTAATFLVVAGAFIGIFTSFYWLID